MSHLQAQFPTKLSCLFKPNRYKVLYGGRGGAKSWGIARALIILGAQRQIRVLCAREFQSSIQDSVHKLLSDQISELGYSDFYTIEKATIKGLNGTTFGFEGIRNNVKELKSYEGADVCWVEEAANVSKSSWEVLIPTIRKDGSEIWISFNPELETDETYRRFVIKPPGGAIVEKLTYSDNPWFPSVLRKEMEELKERDYDAYLNIWEGNCRVTLEGAIYANEMRLATTEGRICHVPYDEMKPVHTFWDLGWADHTSIVFAQKIGFEFHVIDAYQNRLQKLPHYYKVLQDRGYVYGIDYLPHDADHEMLHAPSVKRQMEALGRKCVVLGRVTDKKHGIAAARAVFNRLYFDQDKCADLIQALRHYRYEIDEHGQWSKIPLHDNNSHFADAIQALGQSINTPDKLNTEQPIEMINITPDTQNVQWMVA